MADGRLREVAKTLTEIQYNQLRRALLEGLSVSDLINALRARYPKPADQQFLSEVANTHADRTTRVSFRAIEPTTKGYDVTTCKGRVIKVDFDHLGKMRLNGRAYDESTLRASAESVRKSLDRRYGIYRWPRTLMQIESADAIGLIGETVIGVLLLAGTLKMVYWTLKNYPAEGVKEGEMAPWKIAAVMKGSAAQCEYDTNKKSPFAQSMTGKMVGEMEKKGLVSLESLHLEARCNDPKHPATGDMATACRNANDFIACAKQYKAAFGNKAVSTELPNTSTVN